MGIWINSKTITHSNGLGCSYRQWQATHNNHHFIHGNALSFKLVFECHRLDGSNWIMDPSSIEHIKDWLTTQFSNTLLVAENDPELETFKLLAEKKLCDLRILPDISAEKFAEHVFVYVMTWLQTSYMIQRVTIRSVECIEHDGNSALFVE